MAQCNRAAPWIYFFRRKLELTDAGNGLAGKCFVQLETIDIVYGQIVSLEQFLDGRNRSEPHLAWIETDDTMIDDDRFLFEVVTLASPLGRKDGQAGTIIQRRTVSGRDRSVFLKDRL